jgi:predicted ATPase
MQAEAFDLLGKAEDALQKLDEAQAAMEKTEERWWEAEIYRLRGTLLLRHSKASQAEAESWLRRALDVARSQQAKSLELRAAPTQGVSNYAKVPPYNRSTANRYILRNRCGANTDGEAIR